MSLFHKYSAFLECFPWWETHPWLPWQPQTYSFQTLYILIVLTWYKDFPGFLSSMEAPKGQQLPPTGCFSVAIHCTCSISLIFLSSKGKALFCLHFTDEETEDQRVDLRLHGSSGLVGTKIRSVWSQNLVLNYPSNFKANREVFGLSFVVCYSGTSGLHGSSVFSSYIYDCARS